MSDPSGTTAGSGAAGAGSVTLHHLMGERPFRAVLLPSALASVVFAAWLIADRNGPPLTIVAFVGAVSFALSMMTLLLAFAERHPEWSRWLVVSAAAWVVADAVATSTDVRSTTLIGIGVLWHVALCSENGLNNTRPGVGSAEFIAVGTAIVASVATLVESVGAYQVEIVAGVLVGFALITVGGATFWPAVRDALPSRGRPLFGVVVTVAPVLVAGADVRLASTQPMLIGGVAAAGALATVAGSRSFRAAGSALVVAAVMLVVTPAFWLLALVAMGLALVASGVVEPVLERLRAAIGAWASTLLHGGPLVGWLLGVTGIVAVAVFGSEIVTTGLENLDEDQFWAALESPWIAAGLAVAGLAITVAPWPASFLDASRLVGLRRRADEALARVWRSVITMADRGDAVVRRRSVRAVAQPPTSEPPPSAAQAHLSGEPPREGAIATIRDYVKPVAVWLVANAFVMNVASNASLNGGRLPKRFDWIGFLSLDPTGRIGWGTGDYWAIADHGYVLSEHREAFLPFVPLLLRFVRNSTGLGLDETQVLVASISGLACVVFFWAWMRQRSIEPRSRFLATVLFVVFPWNFLLFGYGYADATVVALVLGAFLLVEREHPIAAGVVGAMAAATRPNGVPIVVALLAFELVRSGALRRTSGGDRWGIALSPDDRIEVDLRRMRLRQWGVLLSVTGLIAFSVFMQQHAGSALYWITQESYFGHEPIVQLAAWLESLFQRWPADAISNSYEGVNQAFTAAVTLGSLLMIPVVRRRFGAAYGLFALMIWMIAWTGSRVFTPTGRLIMPITPFLAVVAAEWLVPRRLLTAVIVGCSVIGSLTFVVLFTRGGNLWVGW